MSDRLWAGTRKGLFRLRRKQSPQSSNSQWVVDHTPLLGDPVTAILPAPDGDTVYAALEHGHFGPKIQVSDNGGDSFEDATAPAYPKKPDGVEDLDPVRRKPIPWTLKTIWTLEFKNPANTQELWCGTIPGGLFESSDGARSWSLNRPLWDDPGRSAWFGGGADFPGIHSVNVHPENPAQVVVSVSCGGVWHSEDGGKHWRVGGAGMFADYVPQSRREDPLIQDPHRVVQCPTEPGTFWSQHHNGIFKSEDGGASWRSLDNVKPSTFGFSVVCHPRDPKTAWFVPAIKDEQRYPVDGKFVVTRTRDGGRTFETLDRGLPSEHAYDLVLRHGVDVSSDGDTLAVGSSSGSLWISENGGDDWNLINAHLPPVYAVRFG